MNANDSDSEVRDVAAKSVGNEALDNSGEAEGGDQDRAPLMSLSLIAVVSALAGALELAMTHGSHRVFAVASILEGYAVLVGAPVFLASLLPDISDVTAQAAKERRYSAAKVLRWPWRRGSLLRRTASWLIIAPVAWLVTAQLLEPRLSIWRPPAIVIAVALVLGLLIGVLGWVAVLVPKSWSDTPVEDVVTLRALIKHENAPVLGAGLAALLLLASVSLRLLDLYRVWRF